ncbi:type II secretion system F family protein [Limnoraphis robusta]|uniref:Type II secretion system F family protein n=1 Tax=Limnoraphis robusta CCNP1315 TaxID=3110306 RepID=A0ABU5U7P4_9CYAN|nr:type II secretion system F family protein [Limnoraphis robusta]MEA5523223.1 type II secretion system F family protein [Limnoraphis robusta CCNP1315]MEA5544776.1 type II secretion system F family protein [Limnoraphis robusta CCNP1324]
MTTNKLRSHSRKQGFDFKKFEEDLNVAMSQITVKDLAIFARQFAAMFNAGIAMARCLSVLSEQCDNARLKRALTVIRADVEEGNSLSESMRKFPDVFDMLFISMVSAGEVGGVLDEVLERLAVMMEKNHKTESEIKSAMSYPKTVLFIALAVFFAMTIFLLPTFAGIFEQIGTELPLFTVIMLSISDFCTTWPPIPQGLVIVSLFILSLAYQAFYKTPGGRLTMDKIFLKLPLFGPLIEKSAVARFCTIFGSLTRAGVPIMNSLEIVRDVAGNQAIANAIEHARTEIQQGGLISLALQEGNVFPGLAIQMISIGEESGELDKMLMKVGAFYETEVEEAVKGLTSALEPMMIVVVGGIVASVLLSMYLPMFKVFESL